METPRAPLGQGQSVDSATPPAARPRVDALRLWSGGLMTALVAALTAVVGVLLVRGVLGIAVFAPEGDGAMGAAGMPAGGAALTAVAATLLLHVLCLGTPQPGRFFSWIITLATLLMMLLPFTTSAAIATKIGTAALYLAVGLTIGVLLASVARGALRAR